MIEYFVHTDLIVTEDNARKFEEAGSEFMQAGGFRRLNQDLDQELVLALKTPEPFSFETGYRGYKSARMHSTDQRLDSQRQKVFRYVNFWRLPHLADLDLAAMMNRCADDDKYQAIDSRVVREVQNFVVRVRWLGTIRVPPKGATIYRVVHQFRTGTIGVYLAAMGPLLPPLEANGWMTLGHFQAVTGPLNTVVEFWARTDANTEAKDLAACFAKDNPKRQQVFKGLSAKLQSLCVDPCSELPQAQVCEVFRLAPYFGVITGGQMP